MSYVLLYIICFSDAVPSQLPGYSKYFSKPNLPSREGPDTKRLKTEKKHTASNSSDLAWHRKTKNRRKTYPASNSSKYRKFYAIFRRKKVYKFNSIILKII